ncbi:MAG: hypothetical protein GPJ54_15210 [Candidatus Heimdallarchaeota archaeon]|nr:hypothetical protein [Candidatus Heimdallarchaeota archaeon]
MVESVLLVLTEKFDDMMFLASQVILEEQGIDVLICSTNNGIAKGQDTSVMTVALSEAMDQEMDYAGIILIHGSDLSNWNFLIETLNNFNAEGKIIGFTSSSLDLIRNFDFNFNNLNEGIDVQNNLIYLSDLDLSENFAEKFTETMIL